MRPTRGFTLTELLTVMAVISLLAALLFPALGQARGQARATACMSNHRQLATAMLLYVDDFQDAFPAGAGNSAFGAQPEDWIWWQLEKGAGGVSMRDPRGSGLARYLGGYKTELLRCPSDRDALAREMAWKANNNLELYTFSYSLNAHSIYGMATYISRDRSVIMRNKLSRVANPSRKIMLAEEKGSAADGAGSATIDDGRWQPLGYALTSRHRGRAIATFADGHVESVPRSFADPDKPEHFDPQH